MKREYIGTGKTVDEAIEVACAALGCERSEIEFEILALAKKSFFGLRTTPAQVKVTWEDGTPEPRANRPQEGRREKKAEKPAEPQAEKKPETRSEKPKAEPRQEKPRQEKQPKAEPRQEKPRQEKPAEKKPEIEPMRPLPELSDEIPEAVKTKADLAVAYLSEVLGAMEVKDFTITPKMREDTLVLLIEGSDLGVVIGRRGETLDSLQVLTGLAANRGEGDYVRVNLDSGNFREKRTKTLEELAVKMARNAVRTGRSTTLEPMNPYDRRIIHAAVAGVEGAASTSIGDEPNRRVVISSLTPRKPRDDRRGSGHGGRGRRGGRGGDRRRDNRPAEAAAPVSEQQAAPKAPLKEAEDKPLYGKIEL